MFFISSEDIETTQKFRAGLVMIDVLSKYAVVVPIKSKTPPDIIAGTMEGLQKMKAKPKMIYTDDERGIASAEFKKSSYLRGLKMMKRRGKQYNGQIIFLKLCWLTTTKMYIAQRALPQMMQGKRRMNLKQNWMFQ